MTERRRPAGYRVEGVSEQGRKVFVNLQVGVQLESPGRRIIIPLPSLSQTEDQWHDDGSQG